jgi:hypothetical protein
MNERILELYRQALMQSIDISIERSDKTVDEKLLAITVSCNSHIEKFAELIVAECVQVAHPKLRDVGEWAAGMRLVQKRIKEHFGVEE